MTAAGEWDDDAPVDPQPPQDLPAEQALLGAVLLSLPALDAVAGLVQADDFYRPAHGVIWDATLTVHLSGVVPDAVAVAGELTKRGELMRCGGAPYLHTLIAGVHTTVNVGYYCDIVVEKARLRRVREAGLRMVHLSESSGLGSDSGEVIEFARRAVEDAADPRVAAFGPVPVVGSVWEFIESLDAPPAKLVESPWPYLNDVLNGGFRAGEAAVVAANTGIGKSVFGANLVRAAAQDGHRTAWFTLEMTREENLARLIADVGTVPLTSLVAHSLTSEEQHRAKVAASRIEEWPLWIDDTPGLSAVDIGSRCQRIGGVEFVVVDQLSVMKHADPRAPLEQQLDKSSWELKVLAKKLGCPMVFLHQLNDDPNKRTNKRPGMNDLRGSKAIGHNVDKGLLLLRGERPGEVTVIVDKHRNGQTGDVPLGFDGRYARITSNW